MTDLPSEVKAGNTTSFADRFREAERAEQSGFEQRCLAGLLHRVMILLQITCKALYLYRLLFWHSACLSVHRIKRQGPPPTKRTDDSRARELAASYLRILARKQVCCANKENPSQESELWIVVCLNPEIW
jgi:hypothetical protein